MVSLCFGLAWFEKLQKKYSPGPDVGSCEYLSTDPPCRTEFEVTAVFSDYTLTNFGSTSRSGRARSLPPTARGNALVDRFAVRRHGRAQDRLFEFCEEGSYYVRAGALHRSARSIRRTPPAGTVNDHLRRGPGAGNARQASDGRFPPILPRLRCDGAGGGAVLIATPLPKKHKPAPARMSRLHYLEAHGNLGRCHPTGRSECSPLTLLLLKACRSSRRVSRSA